MAETDFYRNRDFIPDFDGIMAETEARSRALASRATLRSGLSYGPGPRQKFDLLFPTGTPVDAPLHMFVHGGYWRAGSKDAHTLVAAPVLAAGGIAAIIGYDLMPATRLGAIVSQVRAAARHLVAVAPEIGADPARFSASGHSAGAHLAALLAAKALGDREAPDLPTLGFLLLVSGIYDLSDIPDSFLKNEARMRIDEAKAWSPSTAHHLPVPIRVITRGETETHPFQEQAEALSYDLKRGAHRTELRIEAGRNHLTTVLDLANTETPLGRRLADLVANS